MTKKERLLVSADIVANIFMTGLAMWVWGFVDWWMSDESIHMVAKALMFVAGPTAMVGYIRAALAE